MRRVAVLGAGIMGTCLALNLARRGWDVTIFDREDSPVACASRWNEGKIHLGYLYGADSTFETARRLLPGGLSFDRLLSELVDIDIEPHLTQDNDFYLVHRESVVDGESLAGHFAKLDALICEHKDANRSKDFFPSVRLSRQALAALADPHEIRDGFKVPERSIDTQWVANRLGAALASEPRISLRTGVTITSAVPEASIDGIWRVRGTPDLDEPFELVANALWNGRLEIDLTASLRPDAVWSNRYRRALFVRTSRRLTAPCAVVAVGPFGDVKNYDGHSFYMSWYPAGLAAEGTGVTLAEPPRLSTAEEQRLISAVRAALAKLMPWTEEIFEAAEAIRVEGGYVFAIGQGALSDPLSSLHRRDRFGVRRRGNYISIDTGKYSTAPLLARTLANDISGA